MSEPWIQLHCPDCTEQWEENPVNLPAPDEEFQCPHCGARHPVSEFTRANRDFEILEEFHSD
jgi:DNA-directed RNA polymerase subunit RPC12/RpoP